MKVLVIAAHPSDELLGVGGTLAKHVDAGDEVFACILCKSPNMFYSEDAVKKIEKYTLEAAKIIGIKKVFQFDFPNMKLNIEPMINLVKAISKPIEIIKPHIVYTYHRGDIHSDHKTVFDATMAATRSVGDNVVKKVLCYEDPSSTHLSPPFIEYAFVPNVFVDVSNTIHKKVKALKAYKSEVRKYPHPRSIEVLMRRAQIWGIKVSRKDVEAFELVREIL